MKGDEITTIRRVNAATGSAANRLEVQFGRILYDGGHSTNWQTGIGKVKGVWRIWCYAPLETHGASCSRRGDYANPAVGKATKGQMSNSGHRFGKAMFSIFGDPTRDGSTQFWDKQGTDWTVEALVRNTPIKHKPLRSNEVRAARNDYKTPFIWMPERDS